MIDPTNELGTKQLRQAQGYERLKADLVSDAAKLAMWDLLVDVLWQVAVTKGLAHVAAKDGSYYDLEDILMRARSIGRK